MLSFRESLYILCSLWLAIPKGIGVTQFSYSLSLEGEG